jgi:hypothetical protein
MEVKKTITTMFMVPTLKIPREAFVENGFINGYSKDLTVEIEYQDVIYLLFKPENLERFREFLDNEYERTKSIIEDYDHKNGYVVIVYQLDSAFKSDFDLIKKGKYSKTSLPFQQLFSRITKIKTANGFSKDEVSLQYRIFNRTQDLITFWEDKFGMTLSQDQEVWFNFVEEDETLNVDHIQEVSRL